MTKHVTTCTWDEVPHLTEESKADMLASYPPYIRDARTKGVPSMGAGAIYPLPESFVTVADFPIPEHWPRGFALDAQPLWKSHVLAALDREAQVLYITSAWKRGSVEPAVHAEAIKAAGAWFPGVGDAAGLVADADRERYIDAYRRLGLDITLPDKGVESGIQETWIALSQGGLKVFASCGAWFDEWRLYRRDDKGRIVKENDHLMDCTRYLVKSGRSRMKTKPVQTTAPMSYRNMNRTGSGWMAS